MNHIFKVQIEVFDVYDSAHGLGYFKADEIEKAVEVAKRNLSKYDTTLVVLIPFGAYYKPNGKVDDLTAHTVVWEHDPRDCNNCAWCSAYDICLAQDEAEGPLPYKAEEKKK